MATLHAIDNREYQCGPCMSKFAGRSDEKELTEKMRRLKACETQAPQPLHNINREILFTKCIGNYYRIAATRWLEMHYHFSRGIMPYPGMLLDQPNKVIEIFRVIDGYKRDKLEAEQKAQALRKRQSGKR